MAQIDPYVGLPSPCKWKGSGHDSGGAQKKVHDKRGNESLGERYGTRNSPEAYSSAGGAGWSRRGKDHGSRDEEEAGQDAVRRPLLKQPGTMTVSVATGFT